MDTGQDQSPDLYICMLEAIFLRLVLEGKSFGNHKEFGVDTGQDQSPDLYA